MSDPIRLLRYKFLRLPYHARLRILVDLDLVQDSMERQPGVNVFALAVVRAKEKSVLEKMWVMTEHAHGVDDLPDNPFEEAPND